MLLTATDIRHVYDPTDSHAPLVLKDVSLAVGEGEVVAVVGRSGCGKTTLLNIIAGLVKQTSGQVEFGSGSREAHGLAYAFQQPRLLPWRTVLDNIIIGLSGLKLSKQEEMERAERYLSLVELWDYRSYYPSKLSGGMQQRVSIARALATEPVVLLMDEPFSSLDEFTARNLRTEFLKLVKSLKQSVLLVTHNISESTYMADRVVVLDSHPGRVIEVVDMPPWPRELESEDLIHFQRRILGLLGVISGAS